MQVFFTPDSQNLIISRADEFSFWDVSTLREVRRMPREVAQYPGHVAFSTDGKLMALEMAPGMIHLKSVATGRTIAKLEDPSRDQATWMAFSPDGKQLVVAARFAFAIHVWDLGAIRAQLKPLELDWAWPEFPAQAKPGNASALAAPSPLRIQVLGAGMP
jgi:WD40 repeat protein